MQIFYFCKIIFLNYLFSRDELVDFKEEIERLKKLRGKRKRERKPLTQAENK